MITEANLIDCIHNMQRCESMLRMAQIGLRDWEHVDTMYTDVIDGVRVTLQETQKVLTEIEEVRNRDHE